MAFPEVDDYLSCQPSTSRHFDCRYFNLFFEKYCGLVSEPLNVYIDIAMETNINSTNNEITVGAKMSKESMHNSDVNIIRIMVETNVTDVISSVVMQKISSRHSNSALINHGNHRIYWFQPREFIYQKYVQRILLKYFEDYLPDYMLVPLNQIPKEMMDPSCHISGFGLAYIVKYLYDVLRGREPYYEELRRFVARIEQEYESLDSDDSGIEHGIFIEYDFGNVPLEIGGSTVGKIPSE